MHAQHEGVLTFGDIRFGMIQNRMMKENPLPGDSHSVREPMLPTTRPLQETRDVHGRSTELSVLNDWLTQSNPAC